jgi:GT2 family glycosyltransferase
LRGEYENGYFERMLDLGGPDGACLGEKMIDSTKGEHDARSTNRPDGHSSEMAAAMVMSDGEGREGDAGDGEAFVRNRVTTASAEQSYRNKVLSLTLEVNDLTRQLNQTRAELQQLQQAQHIILASAGYRFLRGIQARLQRLLPANTRRGKFYGYCRRGLSLWLRQGTWTVLRKSFTKLTSRLFKIRRGANDIGSHKSEAVNPRESEYQKWIDMVEPWDLADAARNADSLEYRPLISILMPAYNVDRRLLEAALRSVKEQLYDNWELCVCDDASTNPDVRATLLEAARQDPRIKLVFAEKNGGIAAASNRALDLATGAFVAFLDNDDELAPHALYQAAKLLNNYPDADVLYSDEDKMDMTGRRYDVFLKPDWSPDLMLSCNYLCHLTVLRTSCVREIGGFRPALDGSQDYDLLLRVIERTKKIHHIPKVLYHWRACPGSTASAPAAKMYAHLAARKALQEHLDRCGVAAKVTEGCGLGRWRIRYRIQDDPRVCIIVPSGGKVDLLAQNIKAVVGNTDYRNFEFLIIDNSTGEQVQSYFSTIAKLWPRSRYLDCRGLPFNFSAFNNQAVRLVQAPLLLFLNDDTIPINSGWLEAMLEHAQRPEVCAVGCKLLYANGTIQHAGVVMGLSQNCDHVFKNMPGDPSNFGYFDLANMIRNVSAVTGACLMTRRDVFWEVGGFDEVQLPTAIQDIDLCLKMRARGYLVIYTPHARLFHLESQSKREAENFPESSEVSYMKLRWADVIAHDPYYHPNLTRTGYDCSLETLDLRKYAPEALSPSSNIAKRAA